MCLHLLQVPYSLFEVKFLKTPLQTLVVSGNLVISEEKAFDPTSGVLLALVTYKTSLSLYIECRVLHVAIVFSTIEMQDSRMQELPCKSVTLTVSP